MYSFHIGDCVDPSVYAKALEMSCEVFDYARDELDLTLSVVDIGGGFGAGEQKESEVAYKQAATVIKESAEKMFAAYPDVRLIAEPGRFFTKFTTCSFAQVIGKRQVAVEDRQVRISVLPNASLHEWNLRHAGKDLNHLVFLSPHMCKTHVTWPDTPSLLSCALPH